MTRLFSFEKRYPTSEYDPVSWDAIPETWKTLKGAKKAADRWAYQMKFLEAVVETRVVELIPKGTGRISVPLVEFQGKYFRAIEDKSGKYEIHYLRPGNIKGSVGSTKFERLADLLKVQAHCMGDEEQLTPIGD